MNHNLKLCAFADEADPQLDAQIDMMVANGIPYLEMRGVDGKNVADLSDEEVKEAVDKLHAAGLKVWSLGSPAGGSSLQPISSMGKQSRSARSAIAKRFIGLLRFYFGNFS